MVRIPPQVRHVLYYLNGSYLHGLEQQNAKPLEPLELNYQRLEEVEAYLERELSAEQYYRLDSLVWFIQGFQSTYSLEVLATVDYILQDRPDASVPEVLEKAQAWSKRKTNLLKPEYVQKAMAHLERYQKLISS